MCIVLIGVENQTEIPYNDSEGGNNVCKAWDDHKESGRLSAATRKIKESFTQKVIPEEKPV